MLFHYEFNRSLKVKMLLVMSWILLLNICHVVMVIEVVSCCFIIHYIDCAGIAHPNVVACLAKGEYNILLSSIDIV